MSSNKDEMLKDIQFIKEAVRKNNNILKYVYITEGIKNIALFTGIIIISISILLLWMIGYYGSYQDLPDKVKIAAYSILGISLIGIAWLKINVFLKMVRRHRKDMTVRMLIKEVYTRALMMIMVPFLISIGVFCVYLSIHELSYLIVSILAILFSLLMFSIIAVLNLKDFLLSFGWLLLSGLFSLFVANRVHSLIILIFTFGIAMIILYLTSLISISREKSG